MSRFAFRLLAVVVVVVIVGIGVLLWLVVAPGPADFAATRSSAASSRGSLPSMSRRKATGSLATLRASSSMKHSMAKTLLFGPTPRQKPVGTAGGSARTYSTRRLGMS